MKLLDRYVFKTFAAALLLTIAVFVGLFLAIDLSSKLPRILALKNVATLSFLARYYGVRLPLFLHVVLPAVSLFAAMFTVIRLQKSNELLPMVVSGISLRRISAGFILSAMACAGLMAGLDEFVLPDLMTAMGETDDILISDRPTRNTIAYDTQGTYVFMQEYDRRRRVMKRMTAQLMRPDGTLRQMIQSEACSWDWTLKRWVLKDGTLAHYDEEGRPITVYDPAKGRLVRKVDPLPPGGMLLETEITPEDMQRKFTLSGRYYRLADLADLMKRYPHAPAFRMQYHAKFTTPLGAVVLLFLGLPFVATAQSKSFWVGIGTCLVLTVSYYAAYFILFQAGNRGEWIDPAAAAWAPTLLFGAGGVTGFLRMRS